MMMVKPRYNSKSWVLTLCSGCARPRYCEPHGTTAHCANKKCGPKWTESVSIPFKFGDAWVQMSLDQRRALVAQEKAS